MGLFSRKPKDGDASQAADKGVKVAAGYEVEEHLQSPEEVAKKYDVQINWAAIAQSPGLTAVQVTERIAQYGKNQLTPPKDLPEILKFLKQFTNPLMALLVIAGALTYMAYGIQSPRDSNNLILATALIVVVSLTCIMSYLQERSASNVMASLKQMMPAKCTVYRDGREQAVEAHELVPGDIVRLYIGDRVPADIRVIESAELKVETSSLTGESDLVPITVDRKSDEPEHAHNLVFMSSLVMNGEGRGIVIRTGDRTMIGNIAALAGDTSTQQSSLQVEVHRLVQIIGIIAFTTAIVFFCIGLGRKFSPLTAFVNGFILVIVANVPEGLPATVTSLLALTAMRLKDRQVLIKRTDIIESLGAASIIASDKTGTLTQNKMTVENLWTGGELHKAAAYIPPPPVPTLASGRTETGTRISGSLNRASRRILDKMSSRHAVMGPTLAANSRALATVSKYDSNANMGHHVIADVEMGSAAHTQTHAPPAHSLPSTIVEGQPANAEHLRATTLTPVSNLARKTAPYHGGLPTMASMPLAGGAGEVEVARKVALGRVSVGTDIYGNIQTRPAPDLATASKTLARLSRVTLNTPSVPPELAHPSVGLSSSHGGSGAAGGATLDDPASLVWTWCTPLMRLVIAACVCNKARFVVEGDDDKDKEQGKKEDLAPGGSSSALTVKSPFTVSPDERAVLGDATDAGLLRYCEKLTQTDVMRALFKPVFSIPFNSANKWSLVVAEGPQAPGAQATHLVLLKGAPEIVVTKCTHYMQGNGVEAPIDDDFQARMMGAYERCGFNGERVIGLSYQVIPARSADSYKDESTPPPTSGLVFLGLVSLVDPPRPGVPEAVTRCRSAGVRVAMVTGDHPITAEAIARKVGIVTLKTRREVAAEMGVPETQVPWDHPEVGAVVLTGAHLREMGEDIDTWDQVLDHEEVVFARTSPQQKLQIVEHLQRRGEVVAVTGDGVNDSPALKRAQIGVAMGLNGSDVAREAADIVLMDDQFPSIVNAIEEGRIIFDNLSKTIAYTLTHALPEVFPIFLNLALGLPLGLGGLLILSIDLVTEQGPAISLAYEPAEANVMERPPRDLQADRLVSGALMRYSYLIAGVMEAVVCMIAYFSIFLWHGVPISTLFKASDNNYFTIDAGDAEPLDIGDRILNGQEQQDIYFEAQAAWYVTLVMCQFWHIWMCKTRQVSIFKHGIFRNMVTVWGVCVSITVIMLIVYVPQLHSIFLTYNLGGIGWLSNLIFLIVMLPYTEWSKRRARRDPGGWWARRMQW